VSEESRSPAALAAMLLAIDGAGLGGIVLDHPLHESARHFVDSVQAMLPDGAPQRRVPIGVSADRLIGGVDLAATLGLGRLVAERGVLAAADGGVVVLPMAERLSVSVRTTLSEVLDYGALHVARDGVSERHDARVIAVLLDESVDDEFLHPALLDRLAFRLSLDAGEARVLAQSLSAFAAHVRDARRRLHSVTLDDAWLTMLCQTADVFGVESVRATTFAVRCARAHAALCGRLLVSAEDAEVAARLVLAPRATRLPEPPPSDDAAEPEPPEPQATDNPPPPDKPDDDSSTPEPPQEGGELLRAAVTAALPPVFWHSCWSASNPEPVPVVSVRNSRTCCAVAHAAREADCHAAARVCTCLKRCVRRHRGSAYVHAQRRTARASPCGVKISAFAASSKRRARRCTSSSTHRDRRRSIVLVKPRAPSNCCWPRVMRDVIASVSWRFAAQERKCCCRPPARWRARSVFWRRCLVAVGPPWRRRSMQRRSRDSGPDAAAARR
jgi:hypothetical protein